MPELKDFNPVNLIEALTMSIAGVKHLELD